MPFLQVIDCRTGEVEEVSRLLERWARLGTGGRPAPRIVLGTDRSDPNHVMGVVEHPSPGEAMAGSAPPETDQALRELAALCERPPSVTDLDVAGGGQVTKAAARRFLEETDDRNRLAAYDELCTADYLEHDPAMPEETVGLAEAGRVYQELVEALELRHTAQSVIAEGDLVSARFTVRGRHVGAYQGFPPSGRTFESTGQITLRFREGLIAESWIHWDIQGAMEQLGPPPAPSA
ncbi:ester cyclase [Streptomyces sp. 4N509B]|uniref:ester cyclase n=1 Tax=Streptomyces sp. 4N509B TaxID=3457413 RepID=UPI003FD1D01E